MGDQATVLIVCTGNICRSPFIERLLQRMLDERWLEAHSSGRGILVHSAGTGALTGSVMDEQAAAQLVACGGDPEGFRARDLTSSLIAESDLVLTATREQRGRVGVMDPRALRRVFAFRDFAGLVAAAAGPPASLTPTSPRAWVRQVTEQAAAGRGLTPPLAPADADIVDPYRRGDDVFAAMATQVVTSLPAVVRALAA